MQALEAGREPDSWPLTLLCMVLGPADVKQQLAHLWGLLRERRVMVKAGKISADEKLIVDFHKSFVTLVEDRYQVAS